MDQRTTVLLLTPNMAGGGAQHVMALVAHGLSREKFKVHLGLVRARDPGTDAVPPGVTVHALGPGRARDDASPPAAGVAVAAACDSVECTGDQFSGAPAATIFPGKDARAGATERDSLYRSGSWRRATLHALALLAALSASRSRDLPITRHGRGSGTGDRSSD